MYAHVSAHKFGCLLQSRFHAPTAADAWLMQPTPATGLEASYDTILIMHYSIAIQMLVHHFWHKPLHCLQILPPIAYAHQPATNFNTRFVHVSLNKVFIHSCPVLSVCIVTLHTAV